VVVVSEKIFPDSECAIIFVVSCLAFRFVSLLVTRHESFPWVKAKKNQIHFNG